MGVVAFVSASITVLYAISRFWNDITTWWANNITANKIDIDGMPNNSPLKHEFNELHKSLGEFKKGQNDLKTEIVDMKKRQEEINKLNRGDNLELKIMRGIDHKLPPEQIVAWYSEYKALGRNGAMDFTVSKYIHPQEFDYYNMLHKNKGDD
ncbi:MAG: hypothetical protein LBM02_09430 [Lachnospiraceae bacterium]|nr:hypothetical protein [Lachnospiraceae bacterium]